MLSVILRKQWIEHEKLSYPIILLPYEMTKDAGFYRNRLLWVGFAIGCGIDLLNGISFLYPYVPSVPIRHDIGLLFTEKPLSAIGSTPIHLNPYAIGIGFLMPPGFVALLLVVLPLLEGTTCLWCNDRDESDTGLSAH